MTPHLAMKLLNIMAFVLLCGNIYFSFENQKLLNDCKKLNNETKSLLGIKEN